MSLPFDSCKLYFYMRDKAFMESECECRMGATKCPTVTLGHDREELGAVGVTQLHSHHALTQLQCCDLVRRLTPIEEKAWERLHPGPHDNVYCVHACDDLTAATIIMSNS